MAARLTDAQKKKIIADVLATESYNAAAKMNGVAWSTVRDVVEKTPDFKEKAEQKKQENTENIVAYMESQRKTVCEIITKGLTVLNSVEKLEEASPSQITTAIGTLIDKWSAIGGASGDEIKEDELSRSLRELAEGLEGDK